MSDARELALENKVMRLEAKLVKYESSASPTCSTADRVEKLEDMLFERGAMNEPPCFCCGYNGPGYYQPPTHPCAERHHRLSR